MELLITILESAAIVFVLWIIYLIGKEFSNKNSKDDNDNTPDDNK